MLEQKLVACNDLLKLNEQHKKGKLKTVDFLWQAWNLSQPKGRPPQDLNLSERERVDMWVAKLGASPSYEDFLDFGTELDNPRFGAARSVSTNQQKLFLSDTKHIFIGEYNKNDNKKNGRFIIID